MVRRRVASLLTAGMLIGATALLAAAPVAAHGPREPRAQVLLEGLSSPKGLAIGPYKKVAVSQGAFGAPGPVLLVSQYRNKVRTTPLTGPLNLMDIVFTPDGAGWGIGSDMVLYRQKPGGTPKPILDIKAYQAGDPDPNNIAPQDPQEANPYGLAPLRNGDVLVADAAGNDVIRVTKRGKAWTVARWTTQQVSGVQAEAVPTSITIGKDGFAYVGQLVGGPGTPGSAHIWRLNPNAKDATCSVGSRGKCKDWKSGFTSIIDLTFSPRDGSLFVYEIAKGGWPAFEAGFAPGGVFPPAVLKQVKGHWQRELATGQLSQPGGVVVARDGTIYVTDGLFTGGRLLKIR